MRRLKAAVVNMSCDEVAADISLHVRECVAKDRRLSRFPRDVKDRIERFLTENMHLAFLDGATHLNCR